MYNNNVKRITMVSSRDGLCDECYFYTRHCVQRLSSSTPTDRVSFQQVDHRREKLLTGFSMVETRRQQTDLLSYSLGCRVGSLSIQLKTFFFQF